MKKHTPQPKTEQQEVVLDYIEKYPLSKYAVRTLARIIAKEHYGVDELNPLYKKTVEALRLVIYRLGGSVGEKKYPKIIEIKKSTPLEGLQKLKALKTKAIRLKNLTLPQGLYYLLMDIHIPLHNEDALEVALKHIAKDKRKIEGIILNGDIVDQYTTSRWNKQRTDFTLQDELDAGREFLGILRTMFPKTRIIYKHGNHEERLFKYILSKAPELQIEELTLGNLLWFDKFKIEEIEKGIIKAGKLNILHGHEFGESVFSPVNPARGVFLRAKSSTLVGHYHQISEHIEGNINGDVIGCYSVGSLCDLSPEYRPYAYTKWQHGFAEVLIMNGGKFRVKNYKIINGEVI